MFSLEGFENPNRRCLAGGRFRNGAGSLTGDGQALSPVCPWTEKIPGSQCGFAAPMCGRASPFRTGRQSLIERHRLALELIRELGDLPSEPAPDPGT